MEMQVSLGTVLTIISQVVAMGAVYAALRADVREALLRAKAAESSSAKAHARIDGLVYGQRVHNSMADFPATVNKLD